MTTQEFIQSKHFSTFQTFSGYYQLRWKENVIWDCPAEECFYDKDNAIDVFNDWINDNDTWQFYQLHFLDNKECEIAVKTIAVADDNDAEETAKKILANDMMGTKHIEIYDWQFNYVNDID